MCESIRNPFLFENYKKLFSIGKLSIGQARVFLSGLSYARLPGKYKKFFYFEHELGKFAQQ